MQTAIGHTLTGSSRLLVTGLIGAGAVATDFALLLWNTCDIADEGRGAVALLGLAAYVYLARDDSESLGLKLRPTQGWWYWFKAAAWIGLAVLGLLVAAAAAFFVWQSICPTGVSMPAKPARPPRLIGVAFLHACFIAPVLEETLYRFLVCIPLAGAKRPWLAVLTSGLLFAALHFIYGNPSPENIFGGLFLAWAYLKSGTIVIPVLLHASGNFLALASHIAAYNCLLPLQ